MVAVSVLGDRPPRWAAPRTVGAVALDMNERRSRGVWAVQLDQAAAATDGPIWLLAEGVACLAVARWAQLSPRRYVERIAGALLFSPLSFAFEQAPLIRSLLPGPAVALPFPSWVIEAHATIGIDQVVALADRLGAIFVNAHNVPDTWQATRIERSAPAPMPVPTLGLAALAEAGPRR